MGINTEKGGLFCEKRQIIMNMVGGIAEKSYMDHFVDVFASMLYYSSLERVC